MFTTETKDPGDMLDSRTEALQKIENRKKSCSTV